MASFSYREERRCCECFQNSYHQTHNTTTLETAGWNPEAVEWGVPCWKTELTLGGFLNIVPMDGFQGHWALPEIPCREILRSGQHLLLTQVLKGVQLFPTPRERKSTIPCLLLFCLHQVEKTDMYMQLEQCPELFVQTHSLPSFC